MIILRPLNQIRRSESIWRMIETKPETELQNETPGVCRATASNASGSSSRPGMDANEYALKVTPALRSRSAAKSLQTLITGAEWLGKGQGRLTELRQCEDGKPKVMPEGWSRTGCPLGQDDAFKDCRCSVSLNIKDNSRAPVFFFS